MRILVTVKPQMYREALAVVLHKHYPDAEVALGDPESVEGRAAAFGPDLILRNDTDGASQGFLDGVAQIEVLYSDSMDTRITVNGRVREKRDMDVDELLLVVDEVGEAISGKAVG